jgi:cobalamin-dependent methionine synthase I
MSGLFDRLFGRGREVYRIQVASQVFEFEFAQQRDGQIRIYIDQQPSYGHRSPDLQSTHRYYENGRYFICIMDHLAPRSSAEARTWADYFAVNTTRYIQTGQIFS